MTRILSVIPARYGSTRFPGKPLAPVAGVSLLQRVWSLATAADIGEVLVATDDERIVEAAAKFGARAVMTPIDCRTGTDRVLAAVEALGGEAPTHVLNIQGDAVLTPPWVIAALGAALKADPDCPMVTPAVQLTAEALAELEKQKAGGDPGGTTVTFDREGWALYFSKTIIPFRRKMTGEIPVFRHIGLYGYRLDILDRLSRLPEGRFEAVEGLEQLRALENGICIKVVPVDYRGRTHWSIDSPADRDEAERLIAREGELL